MRAQSAELREVRRRLNSVEKDYQDQLDKQGRRITEGSGQVAELENSLRDQTRRLADSTKNIFDLEQLLDDAEQKLKAELRGNRDRENTITFQAKQIQVLNPVIPLLYRLTVSFQELTELEDVVRDHKRRLQQSQNEVSAKERRIKELETLTSRQDKITVENVRKIQLIESTIDEVEDIVNSKDETIESLKSNIERFRADANKDASKIDELEGDLDQRTREVILKDRKLRELKEKLKKQNESLRDR